jgi:serine/threonine protein phosphatase PrpC
MIGSRPKTEPKMMIHLAKPSDDEIDVYGVTHRGKVRETNQDHFLIGSLRKTMRIRQSSLDDDFLTGQSERLASLAMVADGVGGSAGGEEASRLTLQGVAEYVTGSTHCYYTADTGDDHAFTSTLQEMAHRCHERLVADAEGEVGRATTLTLLLGVWPRAYILQVGDSRYYLYRHGELTQVSRDQTLAQELLDAGVFKRDDRALAQWSNVLSSAIGGTHTSPVVTAVQNDWGYVHLLCTDGLTKHVSDERIAERVRQMTSAKQCCEQLLQDALDGGGSDNVTIVVGRAIKRTAG